MQLLDCTLRDGANVLGKGFPADLTTIIIEGLVSNNIHVIEFGNAGGIGAYEAANMIAPLTDEEYLKVVQPYVEKAELGMFLNARRYQKKSVELAAEYGLSFLRIGAEPGMKSVSKGPVQAVKAAGLKARYSLMKAYLASPKQLVEEAKLLQDCGLDEITIMDSAGAMMPDEVAAYTDALVNALSIPVGFHGHNNLGMSAANALAAYKHGAQVLDCGLMGMARSAGNLATENAVALMKMENELNEVDLYGLLHFIDQTLAPKMRAYDYKAALTPMDIVLGYAGAHSSFEKTFRAVAEEENVDLYQLIKRTSELNRRNPTVAQMKGISIYMKG